MSAQQLADRTAQLGSPIPRSVLANLESGRRNSVSVDELVILARALQVPAILLVFPVGRCRGVEAIPGQEIPPWDAVRWFSGQRFEALFKVPLREVLGGPGLDFPVEVYRDHDFAVATWAHERQLAEAQLEAAERDKNTALKDAHLRLAEGASLRATQAEDHLREVRRRIRDGDLMPPVLPPELSHLEEPEP